MFLEDDIYNTDPRDSLQGLLDILVLIETVIVIQTELVKSRGARITNMLCRSSLVCLDVILVLT